MGTATPCVTHILLGVYSHIYTFNSISNYLKTCFHRISRVTHFPGANKWCLDKNYAGVLIIWDRIFGTFQAERRDEKIAYGLVDQPQSFNVPWLQVSLDFIASYSLEENRRLGAYAKLPLALELICFTLALDHATRHASLCWDAGPL